MSGHTPGPWLIVGDGDLQELVIQVTKPGDGLPTDIARIEFDETDPDCESAIEKKANAALMADAPAMLELLGEIVRCLKLERGNLRNRCTAMVDKHEQDNGAQS